MHYLRRALLNHRWQISQGEGAQVLAYFPEIYPDELLYSALARYHLYVGSRSPKLTMRDLFGASGVRATVGLQSRIGALSQRIPVDRGLSPDKLIRDTTLYLYYTAFVAKTVAESVLISLADGPGDSVFMRLGLSASVISAPKCLRYCPSCLGEMLGRYGEGYWKRSHQLPGVLVCPEHGVDLIESSLTPSTHNQHEFIALSRQNCPPVMELPAWVSDTRTMMLLQDIASRSASLLDPASLSLFRRDWGAYYLEAVRTRGFAKGKERVDQGLFQEAFAHFFEPVSDLIPGGFSGDWPAAMVRKHRKAFHPLRHVLFQLFLDKRFSRRQMADPFGRGPWECFNPLAGHYGQKVVQALDLRSERGRVIGRFTCACGFVYSKVAGSGGSSRILDFGPLLDIQLKQKVAEGQSLRATARELGVDPGTVRLHATRLGLNVPWKGLPKRGAGRVPLDRDAIKTRWLEAQQKHADLSRRQLALLLPKEHRWLYRHDKEWLEQHSPTALRRKWSDQRVDWVRLDHDTAIQLRKFAQEIRRNSPPQRVTLAALERRLGRPGWWMPKRWSKLPKCLATLSMITETVEAFRLRRIVWALEALDREMVPRRAWRVRRLAGLPPKASPKVEAALAAIETSDVFLEERAIP